MKSRNRNNGTQHDKHGSGSDIAVDKQRVVPSLIPRYFSVFWASFEPAGMSKKRDQDTLRSARIKNLPSTAVKH